MTPEEDATSAGTRGRGFHGDGPQDLAIGISNARCPNGIRGGGVVILRGSINGLVNVQSRSYFAGVDGTPGTCTDNRRFGKALATGRFNDDARPDLAIGAGGSIEEHGSVTVLASSITGPGPNASRYFRGSDLPMPPISDSARIGDILATGPLLGPNDLDSLAMGVPYDAVDGSVQSGSVRIVHPSPNGAGLSLAGAERWIQRAPLVLSPPASRDDFGAAIAITDLNGDSLRDIAIGLRNRDGDETNSGAVQVIYQGEYLFRDGFED